MGCFQRNWRRLSRKEKRRRKGDATADPPRIAPAAKAGKGHNGAPSAQSTGEAQIQPPSDLRDQQQSAQEDGPQNKAQSEMENEAKSDLKGDLKVEPNSASKCEPKSEAQNERESQAQSDTKDELKPHREEEPKDLWAAAYAELSDREREILLKDEPHGQPSKHAEAKDQAEITDILDRVIETSEQQYKISQEKRLVIKRSDGRQISVRDSSIRILNGVLSYRDLVTTATALDPTGLATKVWRLVSQGLLMIQMVKNYHDLQVDLFESAGFLADILARYALIEKDLAHYNVDTRNGAENAIVRVYKAVLQYTAEARSAQESFSAAQISSIATPSTEQQLRVLRETIEREEGIFHRWNQLDQQLSHRAEAEALVRRLDDLVAPVNAIQDDHVLSKLPVAQYASFDSVNSTLDDDEFECLPGTREDLLHQIMNWGLSVQSTGSIFWLNGMAGTGKSTISRTVARNLKEHGMLGASFFFKRGESDRGNAKKLFSTIVHQLVHHLPDMIPRVKQAIEKEFNMCTGLLQDQFKKLLIEPLNEVTSVQKVPTRIVVIVIDALDECDGQNDVRRILSLLPEFQSIKTVRVKIFLTSRPEHPIQPGFRLMPSAAHKDFVLHEIKSGVVKGDIEIYLRHKLGQIREENSIHADWPGEGNLKALAEISCPLFISAATFCRFIGAIQFDPERRLVELLRGQSRYASRMGKTYLPVLDQLVAGADPTESAQILHEFQHIVGVIILLETPLSLRSLSALLCTPGQTVTEMEGGIRTRLKLLHSVLSIPVDPLLPIRPLHLSFRDFLVSAPEAEGHRFWVNEQETHGRIADHCIKVMDCLKRNICQLPDYAIERADIGPSALETHLSPELRYACRFWVPHLVRSDAPSKRMKGVLSFLNIHFLHWVEALSLLGCVADGVEMLGALESYFQNDLGPQEKNLLADAKRFVLKGLQMLEQAPLQLYCSGLLFAPTESFVRKTFGNEMPTWITSVRDPEQYWGAELQTLEGHPSGIVHVVFSRDAALLASACSKQIRLWNASTGRLQQMIEPQEGEFTTMDISGNTLLASGTLQGTFSTWDGTAGTLQHSSNYDSGVTKVTFSPDGDLVAAGFGEGRVITCDTLTGSLKHRFSHTRIVQDLIFSPNGKILASCSWDKTIALCDTQTGELLHTLRGHTGEVMSAAFSPKGSFLVSGSTDHTLKLWDSETGSLMHTLTGHEGEVGHVLFFPDGIRVASCYAGGSVKIWDAEQGTLKHSFEGHDNPVITLAHSPCGGKLLSGSWDGTVTVWDTQTGNLSATFQAHHDAVHTMAFVSSGRIMASSSVDRVIKLWDPMAWGGRNQQDTQVGHRSKIEVFSISPDGTLAASGDRDNTLNLWDARTGSLLKTIHGQSTDMRELVFSRDNHLLAVIPGSAKSPFNLWAVPSGTLRITVPTANASGWIDGKIVLSPDSCSMFASISNELVINRWNTETGILERSFTGHAAVVTCLAVSIDGSVLVSASRDATVKIWNARTGSLQATLAGDEIQHGVAISSDGNFIATFAYPDTLRIWEIATRRVVHVQTPEKDATGFKFSKDGQTLCTAFGSFNLEPWYTAPWHAALHFAVERQWITKGTRRVLWLPLEYRLTSLMRQGRKFAVRGNTIMLGSQTGRLCFLRLDDSVA